MLQSMGSQRIRHDSETEQSKSNCLNKWMNFCLLSLPGNSLDKFEEFMFGLPRPEQNHM